MLNCNSNFKNMFKIFTLIIKFKIRKYKKVGRDEYGNTYYLKPNSDERFCFYYGIPEASKIPPQWHAWIHYSSNEIPTINDIKCKWQLNHIPNTTGTKFAYTPKNSIKNAISKGVFTIVKKYTSWS